MRESVFLQYEEVDGELGGERTARPSPAKNPWNISVNFECRKGTSAGFRPAATRFWLAVRTSMHWPRTMSDLLIDPASFSRSPDQRRERGAVSGKNEKSREQGVEKRTSVTGVLRAFRPGQVDDRHSRHLRTVGVLLRRSPEAISEHDRNSPQARLMSQGQRRRTSGAPPWIRTTLTVNTA